MPADIQPSTLPSIAIFGAGGFGREVLMLLHQINQVKKQWHILGFYDDNVNTPTSINNFPYLGTSEDLNQVKNTLFLVIAIGDPGIKEKILSKISNPLIKYPVLLHPGISNEDFQFNKIGEGSVLCQGSILTTNITLGRHVLLNLSCTVGHESTIGDFSALMPGVNIGGNARLGANVYLGTNATVLPGTQVGKNTIIGANAVVTKSLPANCTAVGVPAHIIKMHDK